MFQKLKDEVMSVWLSIFKNFSLRRNYFEMNRKFNRIVIPRIVILTIFVDKQFVIQMFVTVLYIRYIWDANKDTLTYMQLTYINNDNHCLKQESRLKAKILMYFVVINFVYNKNQFKSCITSFSLCISQWVRPDVSVCGIHIILVENI